MRHLAIAMRLAAAFAPLGASPLGAQSELSRASATAARELVRGLTYAFDRQRESAWQDSVRRAGVTDRATLTLIEATVHRLSYRLDAADSAYRRAEQLAGSTAPAITMQAQVGRAAVQAARGELTGAQATFAAVTARMLTAGDTLGAAESRASGALLALRTSGVAAARADLAIARALTRPGDALLDARLACADLQVEVRAGTRVADTTWARLMNQARTAGPRLVAECGFVYAQYLAATGRSPEAVALLDTVATAQTQIRAWHALSSTRQWQGSELIGRGYHLRAFTALSEALALAERSGNINASAWALSELGRLAQRTGAPGDAARYRQRARPLFVASGDRTGQVLADVALGQAALLNGESAGADSLLAGLVGPTAAVSPPTLATLIATRAWIAGRSDLARSAQLIDSVALVVRERNLPGWASELLYLRALWSLRAGRPAEALPRLDSLRARRIEGPMLFETLERRAEAQAALGQLDSAWRSYADATRALERWRQSIPRRELVLASLQDRAFDWDRDLDVATLIRRVAAAGSVPEALAMAEARRVRAREQEAMQRGGVALVADQDRERTVAARIVAQERESPLLDAGRLPALATARLSPTDAIVSYVTGIGGEPTTLFVLTAAGVRAYAAPPVDSLLPDIRRFADLLASGRWSATLAQSLAQSLLADALAAMPASVTRLTIVADGELHRLPFAALRLPDGRALLERYQLAQELSVDDALGGIRRAPRTGSVRSVAIGAPTPMPRVDGLPLPPLTGARREVRAIAEAVRDFDVLQGDEATPAALLRAASRGGRVLHIATHALADPSSYARTAMALQPSATQDGLLRLSDLQQQPISFDLVVLSACASSEGVLLAGQGIHGFVGAVLDAGAGGVIATRWPVGDADLVPWMTRVYDELLRGGDPVLALQRTQQAAMAAGASPRIWAALQYVGDPTLRVTLTPRSRSPWSRFARAVRRLFRGD